MTLRSVDKALAILLLFCVGILIPASASPVRICLLELGLNPTKVESKCCPDCSRGNESPDPCCLDLEEMPDSVAPQVAVELPAAAITDIPADLFLNHAMAWTQLANSPASAPIRGPTSPAAYRAVLGIWRL